MPDNKSKAAPEGVRMITVPVGDNVDDDTVEAAIRSLAPPVAGVVGNLADVQRGEINVEPDPVAAVIEDAVDAAKTGHPSSVGDPHTGASIPGGTYNVKGTK